MRQNKNTWFYIGGSGLDRTDDFQKFCGSGLDRIQFYRIRTGLGLKNFTVAHLCHVFHIMIRLDSCHNQWLETRARVIFAKFQSLWSTNPVCLHTKKWSFFGPGMIKIGATFLFWLSSPVILYPKGQVFITCTEVDLRFAFNWGARRAQYRPIDTSSWSNQVFAYRDNGSRPHTATLSLFQMKWFKLFEYKSNAKIYSSI